jgi:type I protein arginine methyltransferase
LALKAELIVEKAGTAHGLLLWFDAELAPGIGFSNAPGEPEQIYGQTFFPFERPVDLTPGDRIEAEIKANLIEGSYVWSWNSNIWRVSDVGAETTFRQSSVLARILSPRKLARRSNHYVPPIQATHAIDRFCLGLLDGQTSLGEIADKVTAEFPGTFRNAVQALNHVATLVERYHVESNNLLRNGS